VDFDQGAITPGFPALEITAPVQREEYFNNSHFRLWRLQGAAPFEVGAAGEPRILVCVGGAGSVEYDSADYPMARGAVTLLPAAIGVCRFRPDGIVTVLEIAVPEQS
jgi:mannose-6-phosphate isomerase class I